MKIKKMELNVPTVVLLTLLFICYLGGLFVPLVDNDSAHHASIALNMVESGDYFRLIDHGKDYIDKPHFQFWLVATSFNWFGVSSLIYKISSFLFTVWGLFATYSLAKHLTSDTRIARNSVLILASFAAFALANVDVRMDAILTAAVIIATVEGVFLIDKNKTWNLIACALAMAIAFSTKGWAGCVPVVVALICYVVYKRRLEWFIGWHFISLLLLFAAFISPVLYAYYVQAGADGVKFILWNQIFGRMGGEMGVAGKTDHFFYLHTLLWAILPYSLLFYFLFFRSFAKIKGVVFWLTVPAVIITVIALSLSVFKLPHYLNILFPFMAIFIAEQLNGVSSLITLGRFGVMQKIVCFVMLLLAVALSFFAFPMDSYVIISVFLVGVLVVVVMLFAKNASVNNIVVTGVTTSVVVWFALNYNFYPKVMEYQAGNIVGDYVSENDIPRDKIYLYKELDAPFSFDIYSAKVYNEQIDSSDIADMSRPFYLFTDKRGFEEIKESGAEFDIEISTPDYRVTRLNSKFLNPKTRKNILDEVFFLRFN